MNYDKRYMNTFLAGKPIEYRIDFESEAKYFKNLNYNICNTIFKKYYKNNFGTKFISVIYYNNYISFFFIKFDRMCTYNIYKKIFIKEYRKLIFNDIIQN